jgi:hypothetical protein
MRCSIFTAVVGLTAFLVNWNASLAADTQASSAQGSIEGTIQSVAPGTTSIKFGLPSRLKDRDVTVADPDPTAKAKLAKAALGDIVKVDVDDTASPQRRESMVNSSSSA